MTSYSVQLLDKDGNPLGHARRRIASSRTAAEMQASDLLRRHNLNARNRGRVAGGDSTKAIGFEITEVSA